MKRFSGLSLSVVLVAPDRQPPAAIVWVECHVSDETSVEQQHLPQQLPFTALVIQPLRKRARSSRPPCGCFLCFRRPATWLT